MFSLRTFLIREPIMDNLLKRLEDVPYLETDIRILRDDIPILSKQSDIEDSILKNIKFKIKKSVSYLNLWVLLDIQPANSEHLISALKENTSIGSIIFKADKPLSEIKKVSFNQQTVELVINALNCVKYLKNLVIHNSNKALTSAIGTLLKQTSVIKTITIHSDNCSEDICEGLRMNTSLNCVNIISSLNMWITPKGAITAKDALCNNTTIKSIGVSCNGIYSFGFSNSLTLTYLDNQKASKLLKGTDNRPMELYFNDFDSTYELIGFYFDTKHRKYSYCIMFIERKSKEENIGHKVIENFIEQKPIKLFEEFIQNNDWEGLAQLLKDKYTKELLEDIYPESVNSNTKVFVDTLALHSMKHLFEYLQNELNESYSNLNELFKVSDLLVIKREELKKQLHETEQQVIDINATIITKSDLLDKSKNTAKIILENIKAFKERLDKNKQKLDEWQQVLKLNISEWTCDNVVLFLEEIGLKTYSQVFLNNKIDGIVLQSLDTNELMTLQLSFKDAKKISMYLYLIELNRDIYTIPPGVLQWNNKTVCTWLEDNKFSHLVDIFEKNQITGIELVFLQKTDLSNYLKIRALGDTIKLQKEIAKLKDSLKNDNILQTQLDENIEPDDNNKHLYEQLEKMKHFNEELQKELKQRDTKIPEAFICPITQDIMTEPVVASDGHTYERTAIELWLTNNNRSPMTGLQLENKQLVPSYTLKSMIREFLDTNKKK